MKLFKLFWKLHRWIGIAISLVLVCTAVTGLMLLVKKKVAWIQPPTETGSPGQAADFVPLETAIQAALALDLPEFQQESDVARIDVRPARRVYKLRSVRGNREVQIDAISGQVLATGVRRSDFIERLHDGSFFGGGFHDVVMPLVALGVLFLVLTGLWIWLSPKVRRWRKQAGKA